MSGLSQPFPCSIINPPWSERRGLDQAQSPNAIVISGMPANKGFRTVESNRVVHQKYSDYANIQEAVLLVGKTSEWCALEPSKAGKLGQIEKCSQFQVKSSKQLLGWGGGRAGTRLRLVREQFKIFSFPQ